MAPTFNGDCPFRVSMFRLTYKKIGEFSRDSVEQLVAYNDGFSRLKTSCLDTQSPNLTPLRMINR